jgi:hypothetical protein
MVLVTQYIVQIRFNQNAPPDAWNIIDQMLQSLSGGWRVEDQRLEALPGASSVEACMMAKSLAERIDWFAPCVTTMDLLRVVAVDDLNRLFKQPSWAELNREAIKSSNRYVEVHGLPLEKVRQF